MRISSVSRRFLLLPVVLLTASVAVAAAQGRVLRYKHSPGDTALYDCSLTAQAQGKTEAGEKAQATMSLTMTSGIEFLGDTASGDFNVRGSILSGTLKVKANGQQQQLELPAYDRKYVIGPWGEIKSTAVLSGEPPVLMFGGLNLAIGPDDPAWLGGAAIFPSKPLSKGDKWSGTAQIPMPGSGTTNEIKYQSVLLGEQIVRGRVCQKVSTTTTFAISQTAEAPDGSGTVKGIGKATTQDTWFFDAERGVIVSAERSARISMTLKLVRDGEAVRSFTTSGTIKQKSSLKEFNGSPLAR